MKAERQQKESQKAEPIQSKRERTNLSFRNNRLQAVGQTKLIKSIQRTELATSSFKISLSKNNPRKTKEVSSNLETCNVIQQVTRKLEIGEKEYNAEYDGTWVIFQKNGQKCWLYLGKCVSFDRTAQKFKAKKYIIPYIESWINGNLILYRGVDSGHVVYEHAKQGLAPPKPDAELLEPEFTGEHSTTKFIPFSTSRDIAIMAAKNSSRESVGSFEGAAADQEIGVILRIKIGAEKSIGIFDDGEIQVLDPPKAYVLPVIGTTLQYGNRLDRGHLDQASILQYLHEVLDDPMWNDLGVALIGHKVPDGIQKMRRFLRAGNWREVLALADDKCSTTDARRHPETSKLYASLKSLYMKSHDV